MKTSFLVLVAACSIICLFIPYWFAPFLFAFVCCWLMKPGKQAILFHFAFYLLAAAIYCFYAYSTGSKELVTMIGGIFKGLSFPLLLLVSSLFYGVTAMLGAWLGIVFKK